jgi:2-polyprenyl-3-methyl-5-hydroxy-6-metoxy-1,4-benzoquinol methylase
MVETAEKPKRIHRKFLDHKHPDLFGERAGMLRLVPCNVCGSLEFKTLFDKESSLREVFQVVRCKCGLVQVNPQPDLEAVRPYYESHYFKKRTDRGYDNYFSDALRDEIRRVYQLNLEDLAFPEYEAKLKAEAQSTDSLSARLKPRALDAGCAAGYFVEYLKERGWNSEGIEISEAAASAGRKRGLRITVGDFLTSSEMIPESYDLITFWASLEHMHDPARVLLRSKELLKPGGRMILSTCRYGLLARMRGKEWRYMNVPEHLYFFSLGGLKRFAAALGFRVVKTVTYGSGMTTRKDASPFYNRAKKILDPLVKWTGQGDMMAFHLEKMD